MRYAHSTRNLRRSPQAMADYRGISGYYGATGYDPADMAQLDAVIRAGINVPRATLEQAERAALGCGAAAAGAAGAVTANDS